MIFEILQLNKEGGWENLTLTWQTDEREPDESSEQNDVGTNTNTM